MKVSVIMGIYNCADTLNDAIESLLMQTYTNWELIMCDDGSTDSTFNVAQKYQIKHPNRIKLLRNPVNMGLNYTLNKCIELANGDYIARQDGDDISMPQRFEKQIEILEQCGEISIVSTAMFLFDQAGEWGILRNKIYPVKEDLINGTPFAHASSMICREAMMDVGGYSISKRLLRVEDYHLWYKMYLRGFRGMNLSEPLYRCLDDRSAQKRRKFKYRFNECYVRWLILRDLKLPFYYLPLVVKPLIIGLLPSFIYTLLHRRKLGNTPNNHNG